MKRPTIKQRTATARAEEKARQERERNAAIDRQAFIAADPDYVRACAALTKAQDAARLAEHAEWQARERLTQARAAAAGRWYAAHP